MWIIGSVPLQKYTIHSYTYKGGKGGIGREEKEGIQDTYKGGKERKGRQDGIHKGGGKEG